MSDEDKEQILEQIKNMKNGKEYKLEKGSVKTFKGLFVPHYIPKQKPT